MGILEEEVYKKAMASTVAEGFELDPPGYERLSHWTYVLSHVSDARVSFEAAKAMPFIEGNFDNLRQQRAFFVAGIVAYGRCFAQAGMGIPTLDAKAVYRKRPDLMKIHRRLGDLRNTIAAHTDKSDLVRVTLAVREKGNRIEIKHLKTTTFPGDEVPDYIGALDQIDYFAVRKIKKLIAHIEKQTGMVIDFD
jgi:hypothetical protein